MRCLAAQQPTLPHAIAGCGWTVSTVTVPTASTRAVAARMMSFRIDGLLSSSGSGTPLLRDSGGEGCRSYSPRDRLEETGLLGKPPLPEELRGALGIRDDDEDPTIEADEDCEVDEDAGVELFEE
jgi:hypothetical protein